MRRTALCTGLQAVIKDQATGELHTDYKLLEDSPLNFFKVKKESIEKYCR